MYYSTWIIFNFGQIFLHLKFTQNSGILSSTYCKRSCFILGSQWLSVLAENQFRPLYYSTWYIFNFGQIFAFSEIHPKVSRGSNQYSAKLTVKDLAL